MTVSNRISIRRLGDGPIIHQGLSDTLGDSINGPSLIRVPEWIDKPLGRYYLYFAHHTGKHIRLAYANDLTGPWHIYEPGVLHLKDTECAGHIASPDVHVDDENRCLRMHFHGPVRNPARLGWNPTEATGMFHRQLTFGAHSKDGLSFTAHSEIQGSSYLRAFYYNGWWYGWVMPGWVYRSRDGMTGYELGPNLLDENVRHSAVWLQGDRLRLFYTRAGDAPEHIVTATVDLKPDWLRWQVVDESPVLMPDAPYEGGELPIEPSRRGGIMQPVRQLRDPVVFLEGEKAYLIYAAAGEHCLALAEIVGGD